MIRLSVRSRGRDVAALNNVKLAVQIGPFDVLWTLEENFEPIADVPCEVAVGRWIPLEVKLAGTVLEIWVDGRRILRHDDGPNALPAGTVGLRAWRRAASYRNLWVQTGGDREALAFALAGIPGGAADNAAEARQLLAQGRADPGVGLVLITERVAREIRPEVDAMRQEEIAGN